MELPNGFWKWLVLWPVLSEPDVPDRHPECMWELAPDPSHVQFLCNWTGAYPAPTLRWVEDQGDQSAGWNGLIFATEETSSLSVMVNRSMLSKGQVLRCTAQHAALAPGDEKSCLFTIGKCVVASLHSWEEEEHQLLNLLCVFQFRGHWGLLSALKCWLFHSSGWFGRM